MESLSPTSSLSSGSKLRVKMGQSIKLKNVLLIQEISHVLQQFHLPVGLEDQFEAMDKPLYVAAPLIVLENLV